MTDDPTDLDDPTDSDDFLDADENVVDFPPPAPAESSLSPSDPLIVVPTRRILGARLDIRKMLSRPTLKVKWLVDGLTSEHSIGLWSGIGGIGKSYVLMELALALAQGRPLFGRFPTGRPRRVGYFDLEMPKDDTTRRFQRMLKREPKETDWSDLHIFAQSQIQVDEGDSASYRALREAVGDLRLEVVCFDSLRRLHIGEDKDSRQSNKVFNSLKALRDEFLCSFQMIAHWRKSRGDSHLDQPGERLSGSTDWRNFVDTHLGVAKHRLANHMLIYPDKGRQADKVPEKFVIKFDHVDGSDRDGPFRIAMAEEAEQRLGSNYDRVLGAIRASQETVQEIADHLKLQRASVHRVVLRMETDGDVVIDRRSKPWKVSLRIEG